MIEQLTPYPAYKDSGLPWMGQVPAHWEAHSLRTLIRSRNERNRADLPLLSVLREKGVVQRSSLAENENHNFIPDDLSNYKVARAGNLVINKMKAWQGSMGIAPCDGIVSPAYFVFDFRMPNRRYGQALLRSRSYVDHFGRASDGVRVGQWDLSIPGMRQIPIPVPPEEEQAAIVRFLDHATHRLDKAIRAKRKTIALLNEQKQVIIHRAVTRGLDPDVPLKDSGIPWLGQIPAHWETWRIRQIAARTRSAIVNGPFGSDMLTTELKSEGVPVVYIRDISSGTYRRVSKSHVTPQKANSLSFCKTLPGDVLVAKVGDPPGTSAIYPEGEPEAIVTQDVIRIRTDVRCVVPTYLVAVLNSTAGRNAVGPAVVESTRGRISLPDFKGLAIVLPPVDEQAPILDRLVAAFAPLDTTIACAEKEISLLREYRTRLIADVVTGKLDVREAAARLPETAPEPAEEPGSAGADETIDELADEAA